MVQSQRRVLGVQAVTRPQPSHHGLDGDVGKAECSRGKYISNTGVHVSVIALIGGHEAGESALPQDPREIVVPRQDLEESGSSVLGSSGSSGSSGPSGQYFVMSLHLLYGCRIQVK